MSRNNSAVDPFGGLSTENFNARANRNNSLVLLEYQNKNSIIRRSNLEPDFEMNNGNSNRNENQESIGKYIISGHGSIMEAYTFRVPKNINFITLVKLGYGSPISKTVIDFIIKLYKNGNTLFKNNDASRELTLEGKNLLKNLKSLLPEQAEALEFRNHKGGTIANEMFLRFVRDGSTEGQERWIGIRNILKNELTNQPKNIINLYNNRRRTKIDQILLSSLLNMYDDGRKKVFIITACRVFQRNEEWVGHRFAGEISARSNKVNSDI
jgi:hypothetical protein